MIKKPSNNVRLKAATRRAVPPMVAETSYDDDLEPNMKLGRAFFVILLLHIVAVGGIFAFNGLKSQQNPDPAMSGISTEDRPSSDNTAANAAQGIKGETTEMDKPKPPTEQRAPALRTDGTIVHLLRSGETLDSLAADYGVSRDQLITANRLQNVATLRVGQEIVIPPVNRSAPMPAEVQQLLQPRSTGAATAAITRPGDTKLVPQGGLESSGQSYNVEKGDNPYSIARKFNVGYNALLKINGIEDPRRLKIGQTLIIPKSQ